VSDSEDEESSIKSIAAAADTVAAVTATSGSGTLAAVTSPPLAAIFLRPSASVTPSGGTLPHGCQRLVCIRHAMTVGYHVRDTPLAAEGRAAAATLLTRRHYRWVDEVEAVVVSPLTRALQTAMLAFCAAYDLHSGAAGGAGTPPAPTDTGSGRCRRSVPLLVQPLVRERRATMGDVGSEGAVLATVSAFRPAAPQLVALPPTWWLDPGGSGRGTRAAPAAAHTSTATSTAASSALPPDVPTESAAALTARVAAVRQWLRSLPYRTIAVVSHANFLAALGDTPTRLPYCGVAEFFLRP